MTSSPIELSVVVIAGPRLREASLVLAALDVQNRSKALELIIVEVLPVAAKLPAPARVRTIRLPAHDAASWGQARALGTRAATAPIVAFLEDHCYPAPGWAEALIEAHRHPWEAVGYAFTCANPETWVARSTFMLEYGPWAAPQPDGPRSAVSGNNISYKREFLLGLDETLDCLLEADFVLHEWCRQAGGISLGLAGSARAAHECFRSTSRLCRSSYRNGRRLAALRSTVLRWSGPRRVFTGLAAPVVLPLLKPLRLGRAAWRQRELRRPFLSALPLLLLGSACAAAGESAGYLFGPPQPGDGWKRRQFIPKG